MGGVEDPWPERVYEFENIRGWEEEVMEEEEEMMAEGSNSQENGSDLERHILLNLFDNKFWSSSGDLLFPEDPFDFKREASIPENLN